MSKEVQSRVLDPFFTTKPGGTGLGLSVVHGIVTGSGGYLEIESKSGRGTTVRVGFPAAAS
jgi:signal transduction histidine kinase